MSEQPYEYRVIFTSTDDTGQPMDIVTGVTTWEDASQRYDRLAAVESSGEGTPPWWSSHGPWKPRPVRGVRMERRAKPEWEHTERGVS